MYEAEHGVVYKKQDGARNVSGHGSRMRLAREQPLACDCPHTGIGPGIRRRCSKRGRHPGDATGPALALRAERLRLGLRVGAGRGD